MVMRLSTASLHRNGVDSMLRTQVEMVKTQNQLATGKRVQTASDDPAAMGKILNTERARADIARWRSNADDLNGQLGLAENALGEMNDFIDRVRTLTLQAKTATTSDADRQSIAAEIRSISQQMLGTANARDGQGRYLFAGGNSSEAPFSKSGGSVRYGGNDAVQMMPIGATREIAANSSGADIFMRLRSGTGEIDVSADSRNGGSAIVTGLEVGAHADYAGAHYAVRFEDGAYIVTDADDVELARGPYAAGESIEFAGISLRLDGTPADGDRFDIGPAQAQDLFATVDRLAGLLSGDSFSGAVGAQIETALFGTLSALSLAQDHLSEMRGGLGTRLQAVEDSMAQLEDRDAQLQASQSGLQDLDYAEAASRLSQQELSLQAAQQSYLKIQALSLFDYL